MTRKTKAFTLIELLIVVAIIAILAAIAVPNFLEAQVRAKVSRAKADMRSVVTAIEAYQVDYNKEPKVTSPIPINPGEFSAWWGFVPSGITTPIAYMTTMPVMPFTDSAVTNFWERCGGTGRNQPYTMVRNTNAPTHQTPWLPGGPAKSPAAIEPFSGIVIDDAWFDKVTKCGYFIYTGGPDGIDGTVWGAPMLYDPTNGTMSFGDIHHFGSGSPDFDDPNTSIKEGNL